MSRWDSAAIVPNTSELLPEPDTPVKTVSRRFGSSTLTSLRLFTRAPCTRIASWRSAPSRVGDGGRFVVVLLIRLSIGEGGNWSADQPTRVRRIRDGRADR